MCFISSLDGSVTNSYRLSRDNGILVEYNGDGYRNSYYMFNEWILQNGLDRKYGMYFKKAWA